MKKNKKEKRFRKKYCRKIKKPFYKKKFFINFVIIFVFLASIFYFLVFFDFFSIKKIEISGNQKIESNDLIEFLEKEATRNLFFLESKSIFMFFPKNVASRIPERYPSLFEFQLFKQYPDTLKLKVKERESIGVWCEEKNCFSFDRTGKIFEKARIKKGLIVQIKGADFLIGEKILSAEKIKSLIKIWNRLNPKIGLENFSIEKSRVDVLTKENWLIHFSLEEDVDFQLTKLELALEDKILGGNRKKLEYVDLRFDKGIYFKYRGNELINIIDEY